ncbi:MAG: hypothetical protein ACRDK4_04215 [Solirubrobacteraceae bacterium]
MSVPETLVVLDDVIVVYRPFTNAESRALRGFVQDARRLGSMRFFKEVPTRASLTFDNESGLGLIGTMQEPEDEALRAAITQFRQLYDHNEPRSFNKTISLLKRSAHEHSGNRRDEAINALDEFIEASHQAMAGIGMAIVFENPESGEQRRMTAEKIIDAYLHGKYLHSGNDKSKVADDLDGIPVMSRLTFYSVMLNLSSFGVFGLRARL